MRLRGLVDEMDRAVAGVERPLGLARRRACSRVRRLERFIGPVDRRGGPARADAGFRMSTFGRRRCLIHRGAAGTRGGGSRAVATAAQVPWRRRAGAPATGRPLLPVVSCCRPRGPAASRVMSREVTRGDGSGRRRDPSGGRGSPIEAGPPSAAGSVATAPRALARPRRSAARSRVQGHGDRCKLFPCLATWWRAERLRREPATVPRRCPGAGENNGGGRLAGPKLGDAGASAVAYPVRAPRAVAWHRRGARQCSGAGTLLWGRRGRLKQQGVSARAAMGAARSGQGP